MANHYIRAGATGTNTGASWANAWPTFAAVTWTRGDTYFVAGGTYNENPIVTKALSGTTWIYVKKANATDNSADAGWSASYASDVALITGVLQLWDGYISWDGVTGAIEAGHGFKVYKSTITGYVVSLDGSTGPYVFRHTEVQGAGFAAGDTGQDGIVNNNVTTAKKNLHVAECYIHDLTRNGITLGALIGTSWSDYGLLFENNVLAETGGCTDPQVHGQGMQISYGCADAYTIIRGNRFRNVTGSGFIAWLGGSGSNHSFARVYNNVFYMTDLATYSTNSPGVLWVNDIATSMTDFEVYNNTFWGLGSAAYPDVKAGLALNGPTATNISASNNLWENSYFPSDHDSSIVESNNGYYNNTGAGVPSGTTNQINGSATSLSNAAAGDFTLVSGGYAVGAGADLSATFTTDITGATRSVPFDLGAYEYDTNAVSVPAISPAAGSYSEAQSVTITCATSGASIRYTTDGSTPSDTVGTAYTGAFSVTASATVKAIAYKAAMTNSSVASSAYTITIPVATQVFTSLTVTTLRFA